MSDTTQHRDWSGIPKQTILNEDGRIGDCWRCCIAAILGLPAEDVPHFLEDAIIQKRDVDCLTQEWLNERGMVLVLVSRSTFHFTRQWREDDPVPWPPVISCGPSPRSKALGEHHATVSVLGKIVYDPHPSNAGLTYVSDEYMIVPCLTSPS